MFDNCGRNMDNWRDTVAAMEDVVKFIIDLPYFMYIYIKALVGGCIQSITHSRKSLEGETVLVTGAAMGLGKSVVLQLAGRANITLVLWDINKDALHETADECRQHGAKVYTYIVDISNQEEVKKAADKVRKEVGHVTILHNNAGIVRYGTFLDVDPAIEEKIIQVNLMSNFWIIRAFLPDMIDRGKGHVVTTSSGLAFQRNKFITSYVASKFAQRGFLESLQLEMRLHPKKPDIKFSTVYPAWIKTPMTKLISFKPRYNAFLPMDPDYVAGKIIDGIEREKEEIFVPGSLKLLAIFCGCIPSAFVDYMDEILYKDLSVIEATDQTNSVGNKK